MSLPVTQPPQGRDSLDLTADNHEHTVSPPPAWALQHSPPAAALASAHPELQQRQQFEAFLQAQRQAMQQLQQQQHQQHQQQQHHHQHSPYAMHYSPDPHVHAAAMQGLPPLQPMQRSPPPAVPAANGGSSPTYVIHELGATTVPTSDQQLAQRIKRLEADAARRQARRAVSAYELATAIPSIPPTLEAALKETNGLNHLQLDREYRRLALYAAAPAQRSKAERKIQQLLLRAKNSMSAAMAGGFATAAQAINGVAAHLSGAAAAAGSAIAAAASSVAGAAGGAAAAAAPAHDEGDPDATTFQTEAVSAVVFQAYQCRSLTFGVAHPCEVTEAGTLSGVDLPPARYPLQRSLPPHIINDGLLSSLQLEGVLYASQRTQQILHDGTRAGFFLADGAGVGKGRQIAAVIMDSLYRGLSNRACWFSVSTDLYLEAKRDLAALGCNVRVIKGLQQIDEVTKNKNWGARDLQLHRSLREGVLFSTYGTLVSGLRGGRGKRSMSRLDQLVEWLGGDEFEGVLVFDECHRAKNFDENEEKSTATGTAVVQLQVRLPRARIVYASATGVTDIKNMAYFNRLGLWGPGNSNGFATFKAFESSVSKRGIGAFELLAMELKGIGSYVSRGLSYASCEYVYVSADLDDALAAEYDAAVHFWLDLKEAYALAVHLTGSENAVWKIFWSTHQRFFGALCSSAKVDTIVAETEKALAEGYAVVIGLQSTGESSMAHQTAREEEEAASKRQRGEDGARANKRKFPSLFKEMILRFLETHFPVEPAPPPKPRKARKSKWSSAAQSTPQGPAIVWGGAAANAGALNHVEVVDEESRPSSPVSVAEDDPQETAAAAAWVRQPPIPAAVEMRDAFIKRAKSLVLPSSPLDDLIHKLGGSRAVAEMTGRRARYLRKHDGSLQLEVRGAKNAVAGQDATADVNIYEKNLFMSGKKLIAIISDAASTGISLHADRAVQNQRKRMHITMELPWSADKAIQQLGRTHRSNEVCGVLYALVTSNLGGERRFSSACAARLQSLGALTKGDRRAATGSNQLSQFDFDRPSGRKALKAMVDAIFRGDTNLNEEALQQLEGAGQNVLPPEEDKEAIAKLEAHLSLNPPTREQLLPHESEIPHPLPWSPHNALCWKRCLEAMGFSEGTRDKIVVKNFLNRILGLPVAKQNGLFEYFVQCLNHLVLEEKRNGIYDDAVSDVSSEHVEIRKRESLLDVLRQERTKFAGQPHPAAAAPASHHKANPVPAAAAAAAGGDLDLSGSERTFINELSLDRGISFEAACAILRDVSPEQESPLTAFHFGHHPITGAPMPLLAVLRANSKTQYQVYRPNTGRASTEMSKSMLLNAYEVMSQERMEAEWTRIYDECFAHCVHGRKCKFSNCEVGRRIHLVYIVTGHVFSYLTALQRLAQVHAHMLKFNERQIRVVRVCTDDGTRLVGLLVPKLVLDKWVEQLATGQQPISAGLGIAAKEEPPKDARSDLITKYTGRPHTMPAAPSFFAGGEEVELHSNAPAVLGDAAAAAPHHLASPRKHTLPSLMGAATAPPSVEKAHLSASKPAVPDVVSARKQTSLASFFAPKPKAPPAAAAAAAPAHPVKRELSADAVPTIPSPPPSPPRPLPPLSKSSVFGRGTSADAAIDLISSDDEDLPLPTRPPQRAYSAVPTLLPIPQHVETARSAQPHTGSQQELALDEDDFLEDGDEAGLAAALAASRADALNGANHARAVSHAAAAAAAHDADDAMDEGEDDDSMPPLE